MIKISTSLFLFQSNTNNGAKKFYLQKTLYMHRWWDCRFVSMHCEVSISMRLDFTVQRDKIDSSFISELIYFANNLLLNMKNDRFSKSEQEKANLKICSGCHRLTKQSAGTNGWINSHKFQLFFVKRFQSYFFQQFEYVFTKFNLPIKSISYIYWKKKKI